jgi:hypothetical protein
MAGISDFYRGDSRKYTVTLTTAAGVPISVHDGTLYLTFKSDTALADTDAEIQVSTVGVEPNPADPTGVIIISLTPTNTNVAPGTYNYDFQFVSVAGEVKTILPAVDATITDRKVEILTDITRTTP